MPFLLQICLWVQQLKNLIRFSRNLAQSSVMEFKLEVTRSVFSFSFIYFNSNCWVIPFGLVFTVLYPFIFLATGHMFRFCGIWIFNCHAECTWGMGSSFCMYLRVNVFNVAKFFGGACLLCKMWDSVGYIYWECR